MSNRVTQTIKYLSEFLTEVPGGSIVPREIHPKQAPHWTKEAAQLYGLPFRNTEVILADLAPATSFSQAINLYRVLSRLKLGPVLLLADHLPAKARGVLVRMRVPHMTSHGAIYAPELGLAYRELPTVVAEKKEFREKLLPTSQKLVVARLLKEDFIKDGSTLTELQSSLAHQNFDVSLSTLSRAFQQLEHFGLVQIAGSGPQKKAAFLDRELLWSRLLELETEVAIKKVQIAEIPPQKIPWVFSSDSALARLSELNRPDEQTIAMSFSSYRKWSNEKKSGSQSGKEQIRNTLEIWRADPVFLARDRVLNPIELSLSLRRLRDPRVQLAVSEIIDRVGLNSKLLWEAA